MKYGGGWFESHLLRPPPVLSVLVRAGAGSVVIGASGPDAHRLLTRASGAEHQAGSAACSWWPGGMPRCPPSPGSKGRANRPARQPEGRTVTEASVSLARSLTDQDELSPRHGETCAAGDALLLASAAFAVPAPLGVAQPLPAVLANPTEPGLGHGDLLGQEPF